MKSHNVMPVLDRRHHLQRNVLAIALVAVAGSGAAACASAAAAPEPSAGSATATTATPTVNPSVKATPTAKATAGLHMIPNGGHQLAFYVTPGHLPAIVLDAGGGNGASSWNKVAPVLAKQTGSEIITYDRSGEGKSTAVPGPWIAQHAVADLHAGLTALGVGDHIVLVSHSLAAEIATYYVRKYPGDIDGAVLVDASLPTFYTNSEVARIVAATTPLIAEAKKAPSTQATRQLLAEAVNYGPVHSAYHTLTWPQSVPATVIVSADTPYTGADADWWRQAAATFVKDAPNRRYVTALKSSHDIEIDRPDVIITEVETMIKKIQ